MYLSYSSPEQIVSALQKANAAQVDALWLLCVADSHGGQLPSLLTELKQAGIRVFGGLFPGLIYGEEVKHEGILAIALPTESQILIADLNTGGIEWREQPPALTDPVGQTSSLLLLDCLAPNITAFMEEVYNRYGNQLVHYGAGAGYHDLRQQPPLFTEHGMFRNAAMMALIPRRATVRVRHGWSRVAGPFVASRTKGNIIQELNWEPAATFYRREVEGQNPDYAGRPVFPDINSVYPLCIAKEGGEDVMRDPIGQTDADEIVVLSDVAENSVMYLAHGDHDSLIGAAAQAIADCAAPDDVAFCFISDCFSRVLKLGDTFTEELRSACNGLRRFTDAKPEGVLALGEVATHGGQYLELFNKTFVVALSHR
ncbi:MAG: FIST C-terminal domain-containing protein [Chromatiales bacterium]|nr:FIST C-terminal domain-containing protein [Chromatiales bacterium]